MKRFSERGGHSTMAELNITPLLDLAFVLLIIFVITTPLLENSIEVQLPIASSNPKEADPNSVKTVAINVKGEVYVDKGKVVDSQLDTVFRRLKAANPEVAIAIRADRDIKYQRLVDVLDALKRAQISKVGLVHQSED
jgi:biopolymer transport protein ExbD